MTTAPIWVRMYAGILGDCFLLCLPGQTVDKPVHMLIDFGMLQGTNNSNGRASAILEDICTTTKNHLDIVVVTHEHWDHLSGFHQAGHLLDKLTIDELWLAWTEDEHDSLAQQLRRTRQRTEQAITKTLERHNCADRCNLSAFRTFAAAGTRSETILADLRSRAKQVHYLTPGGNSRSLPQDDARFYVLGPPRDTTALGRSTPRRNGKQVYELSDNDIGDYLSDGKTERETWEICLEQPFEDRFTLSLPNEAPFGTNILDKYFHDTEKWRKIDEDWLDIIDQLALKLDSDTNNTSLVLAIELGEPGKGDVLLFPGDAQVGNWESWFDHQWTLPNGRNITAEDLLARTILYKVGHHGSHNATLRERGLELMTHPDLVAMIPVDGALAERKNWKMPLPGLLEQLLAKTKKRVIRGDEESTGLNLPVQLEWRGRPFLEHCQDGPNQLYRQFTLS